MNSLDHVGYSYPMPLEKDINVSWQKREFKDEKFFDSLMFNKPWPGFLESIVIGELVKIKESTFNKIIYYLKSLGYDINSYGELKSLINERGHVYSIPSMQSYRIVIDGKHVFSWSDSIDVQVDGNNNIYMNYR